MCDITNLFKATVKTIRTRQKALGLSNINATKEIPGFGILSNGPTKHTSDFYVEASNIVSGITKLKDVLLEQRKAYLSTTSTWMPSSGVQLTDAERNQIDETAQGIIKNCSAAVDALKADVRMQKVLLQIKEHREAVLESLKKYLKDVCKVYSEQKAIKVKKIVDRKIMSRLESTGKSSGGESLSSGTTLTKEVKELTKKKTNLNERSEKVINVNTDQNILNGNDFGLLEKTSEDQILSPEEIQIFERENEQLFEEMNNIVDEVRQIQGKVVEISRLQEVFTDKILQQERDIDKVSTVVVGSTENIKGGNEEIREAMKNNAGLRVWILFFLIVSTLSLLFLDWYNP